MAAGGIVPPLDVAEDRHPGLGLRCEAAAYQQLAFQCGEEALAHGVVVGVTDRSHGWAHTGFPAAAAERQRCILGALVALKWKGVHRTGSTPGTAYPDILVPLGSSFLYLVE